MQVLQGYLYQERPFWPTQIPVAEIDVKVFVDAVNVCLISVVKDGVDIHIVLGQVIDVVWKYISNPVVAETTISIQDAVPQVLIRNLNSTFNFFGLVVLNGTAKPIVNVLCKVRVYLTG